MKNQIPKSGKKKTVKAEKKRTSGRLVSVDDIRRRAYEIYLENEGDSDELENWIQAERELTEDIPGI
jgi:hypothetical protein